jgi:hypothetical protein
MAFVVLISACGKKCKVCNCTKNHITTTQKNCAYGGGSSNATLETWEDKLKQDYDTVVCHFE